MELAFVTGVPLGAPRPTPVSSQKSLTGTRVTTRQPTLSTPTPRMGYGDYSYLTDRTKGHVQQYYVDKFRVASDFTKGAPQTDADAKLGRNIKGAVFVPLEGIPQEFDPALPTSDEPTAVDPRLAESEGSVYPWDVNYVDPAFGADTFAKLDDEEVSDNAFAAFRSSLATERGAALSAMDFGACARVNRIKEGLDEAYLLCLDGKLDARYARLQNISDPPEFNPYGVPQTEIPGTPFVGSVGALDLQPKPKDNIAFWEADDKAPTPYKRPSGAETPDLPYNPSVPEMIEAQKARGLLPASE